MVTNAARLGILEAAITRVPGGRASVMPGSERTFGPGRHTAAAVWTHDLVGLLTQTEGGQ